jgi:hypothetical protein
MKNRWRILDTCREYLDMDQCGRHEETDLFHRVHYESSICYTQNKRSILEILS